MRRCASPTNAGYHDPKTPREKLVLGTFYDLRFDLEPEDEFIPPGKRLAVMIMSS